MPVIRNPFRRNASATGSLSIGSHAFFESEHRAPARPQHVTKAGSPVTDEIGRALGSKARSASAISIPKSESQETQDERNTYKLSVVNDSGVYLPPSPPDKKSCWRKGDNSPQAKAPAADEPFVISRESFESYRRSFDISARSPVSDPSPGRVSFDSRPLAPRGSLDIRSSPRPSIAAKDAQQAVEEDKFEEIKLNDDVRPTKKRSLFYRFGTDHSTDSAAALPPPGGISLRNGLFGRKDTGPHDNIVGNELKRIDNAKKEDK